MGQSNAKNTISLIVAFFLGALCFFAIAQGRYNHAIDELSASVAEGEKLNRELRATNQWLATENRANQITAAGLRDENRRARELASVLRSENSRIRAELEGLRGEISQVAGGLTAGAGAIQEVIEGIDKLKEQVSALQ